MNNLFRFSLLVLALALSASIYADAEEKQEMPDYMKPYTGSAEFEQLKTLVGTWNGTGVMHDGKEEPVTVVYETSAGGSVVIEKSFPGTPAEMITIYSEKDGQIVMTHYCMLKNQPELALKNSGDGVLEFDLVGGSNMDASKDMHMHSLKLTIKDDDTIVQEWAPYMGGQAMNDPTKLTLTRAE